MGIILNEYNKASQGGTEISIGELTKHVDPKLLDQVQIIPSRFRGNLDPNKPKILWIHDLVGDPEFDHLLKGGHQKFDLIVFVSNWQMQQFIRDYNIPWSKCIMLYNAIEPITPQQEQTENLRLIYHTTPHRGLAILVPVFEALCRKHPNITLDVFSSFKIYGWEERDKQYEDLYEQCRRHPQIVYHGFAKQAEVREAVSKAHIFAYPSIWQETGCRSLMEAMSAGCECVHPNYGALFETANQLTRMYHYSENVNEHANRFYSFLDDAITNYWDPGAIQHRSAQKAIADALYGWDNRARQWNALLTFVIQRFKERETFVYDTSKSSP